ncbi:MAG TPA: cytochrome c [Caldithrix abyssi]|uniref:Cytochrome c n=1 Tax=Caldithrix abyssi TaxID=187145 RepID=A0A7V1LY96_CALAY|nr:cytochrome c [Caldithrix abyssi]
MLSKKQAKMFFLGGTAVFFLIFIGMTVDTLVNGVPKYTHASQIDDQVRLGRHLWDSNNCMGCHTIMGEGAYYAPELTKVYERRGPEYIKTTFNFPGGWRPNGRNMVEYNFTEQEKEALVAFLKWVGESDLNGFPPKPSVQLNK